MIKTIHSTIIREGSMIGTHVYEVDIEGPIQVDSDFDVIRETITRYPKSSVPILAFTPKVSEAPDHPLYQLIQQFKDFDGYKIIATVSTRKPRIWFPLVDQLIWSGPARNYNGYPVHELHISVNDAEDQEPVILHACALRFVKLGKDIQAALDFVRTARAPYRLLVESKQTLRSKLFPRKE